MSALAIQPGGQFAVEDPRHRHRRRYVYRAPVEPEPRATASGTQNIVHLGAAILPTGINTPGPCPAWGCDGPEPIVVSGGIFRFPPVAIAPLRILPGATSLVPQPPPVGGPVGGPIVPGGGTLALSPAPSPTVAVPSSQTAPQLTQPGTLLDASGASPSAISGFGTWLGESTLISTFPNWAVLGVGALAAWMLLGSGKGRR